MAHEEMAKAYQPGEVEAKWYKFWLDRGYFKPDIDPKKEPFVIIMPPPNVTGELHLGHAVPATLEDIMVRWHRMMGEPTLWLPGVDHAGIAAQVVVERVLAKEGTSRHELGREKFLERMWQWAESCRGTIRQQHQRLGISCDWDREVFTLDEGPSRAVRTVFVRLYEQGLIYRGERIINWCPRCATALSDLEVDHNELAGHLYYVRYPLAGEKDKYITVATTRPETILGDTAVAVNPHDERYKGLVSKKVILPAIGRAIPIVADEAVDPAFGTGAVKITPAHDPVDFDVAQRHKLPLINILNSDATLNQKAGKYAGLERFAGRKALLADLEKDGLLVKVEDYSHAVGHCHRCNTVIEPIASQQWFVSTKPLAGPAIEAVTSGRIKIIPERFNKVYLNWMENIRDWCISRQLWWGHRIPVWYCKECGHLTVAVDDPESCSGCHSAHIEQDPDVLDTWFSSALWPHSILGWPDDTEDLNYFYPTSVMETGYDIIFFWVARMIMMGLKNTGRIPFQTVFLHGLVRDEKGEKMSKVKGNVLNPLDTLEKYGTDALRFALSTGTSPGNDFKISTVKLEAGRNFANKLWNAARFVIKSIDDPAADMKLRRGELPPEDRWILSRLSHTITSVSGLMEDCQFGEALRQLHDFWWSQFCDWYIELSKVRLRQGEGALSPLPVLVHVTDTVLRLLHPSMPFVTEELWQHLKSRLSADWQQAESIMVAEYPQAVAGDVDAEAEKIIGAVIEIVHAIRNARAQHKVAAAHWIEAAVYAGGLTAAITPYGEAIQALAKVRPLAFHAGKRPAGAGKNELVLVLGETEVVIPMATMVDLAAESKRRQEEIAGVKAEVTRLEARLSNEAFTTKAPSSVVEGFRSRLASQIERLKRLETA